MVAGFDGRYIAGPVVVAGISVVPAPVSAQTIGPATLVEVPGVVRAIVSVLAVALIGWVLISRHEPFLDRAVGDTLDRPGIAVVYGLLAYAFVLFLTFYGLDILSRVGAVGSPLGLVVVAIPVVGTLLLSSLGYVVVGRLIFDIYGDSDPMHGLALGAALSGVGWLFLPFLGGLGVWVLIAAVGIGGPTRTWVHGEHSVATEVRS